LPSDAPDAAPVRRTPTTPFVAVDASCSHIAHAVLVALRQLKPQFNIDYVEGRGTRDEISVLVVPFNDVPAAREHAMGLAVEAQRHLVNVAVVHVGDAHHIHDAYGQTLCVNCENQDSVAALRDQLDQRVACATATLSCGREWRSTPSAVGSPGGGRERDQHLDGRGR